MVLPVLRLISFVQEFEQFFLPFFVNMQVFIIVKDYWFVSWSLLLKADANRTEEMKTWKIPHKFINDDFVCFLSFLIPLDENYEAENRRPITGDCSVRAWANDYQLQILHSIDLGDILKLLEEKGCVKIHRKENYVEYRPQDIKRLTAEIRARIK